MTKCKWTEDELKDAIKTSYSYATAIKKLGLIPAGGNYASITKYVQKYSLDTSHFRGKGWSKGTMLGPKPRIRLLDILVEHSTYKSSALKQRLIREYALLELCSRCLLQEWEGNTIPLELDHINGVKTDNRIENLRLLCPNCHALTPTYRGRNIGGGSPTVGDKKLKPSTV